MIPNAMADNDPRGAGEPSAVDPVEEYKAFVDGLIGPSTLAKWARSRWPENETDLPARQVNELLCELTPERRELLARMLERAEESGILKVLYLLDVRSYRLSREGVELPHPFPYGRTSVWGSWSYRKMGDAWPTGPGEEFASAKKYD